jgi:hypothetical protein
MDGRLPNIVIGDESSTLRSRRLPRMRGGAGCDADTAAPIAACAGSFCFIIVLKMLLVGVNPLMYGLKINYMNGAVDDTPIEGGLHFVLPWQEYMTFPRTAVTLVWANKKYGDFFTEKPIRTRTGGGKDQSSGGGQPIGISCSMQVQFAASELKWIYMELETVDNALKMYRMWIESSIMIEAQQFDSQDFWTKRAEISDHFLTVINAKLKGKGAQIINLQILKVDFAQQFEDSIIGIQKAIQQMTINEGLQKVTYWQKQVNVYQSAYNATITEILATATQEATLIQANASCEAFSAKQSVKADGYESFKNNMKFTNEQMLEYIKIRGLITQSMYNKVAVNVPQLEFGHTTATTTKV